MRTENNLAPSLSQNFSPFSSSYSLAPHITVLGPWNAASSVSVTREDQGEEIPLHSGEKKEKPAAKKATTPQDSKKGRPSPPQLSLVNRRQENRRHNKGNPPMPYAATP